MTRPNAARATGDLHQKWPCQDLRRPEPRAFSFVAAWVYFELTKNLAEINRLRIQYGIRNPLLWASKLADLRCRGLNSGDVDEVLEPGEVVDVACVQPGAMGVGGGGDEEIQRSATRLAPGVDDGSGEPAVADRDRVIDR